MAVSLTSTSARLQSSDGAFWTSTGTGTLFIRVKPNWSAIDSVDHVIFDNAYQSATTWRMFRMEKFSDNSVYMGWQDQGLGDFRVITSATGFFTNGTWTNHALTWSTSTGTTYYVDNVNKGTAAAFTMPDPSLQTTSTRETFGGSYQSGTFVAPVNASLAEYARWNRILSSNELQTLQNGYSPIVLMTGLMEYRPFADFTGTRFFSTTRINETTNALGQSLVAHPATQAPPTASALGVGL